MSSILNNQIYYICSVFKQSIFYQSFLPVENKININQNVFIIQQPVNQAAKGYC